MLHMFFVKEYVTYVDDEIFVTCIDDSFNYFWWE